MARRTVWHDTLFADTVATGAALNRSLMLLVSQNEARGLTLVRTILDIQLTPSIPLNDGMQMMDIGIGLASRDSFSAGDLPDPGAAADEPIRGWIFRTRCAVMRDATQQVPVTHCVGDFRAMRKIDAGELYAKFDNTTLAGTAFTVFIVGLIRCLFLLP